MSDLLETTVSFNSVSVERLPELNLEEKVSLDGQAPKIFSDTFIEGLGIIEASETAERGLTDYEPYLDAAGLGRLCESGVDESAVSGSTVPEPEPNDIGPAVVSDSAGSGPGCSEPECDAVDPPEPPSVTQLNAMALAILNDAKLFATPGACVPCTLENGSTGYTLNLDDVDFTVTNRESRQKTAPVISTGDGFWFNFGLNACGGNFIRTPEIIKFIEKRVCHLNFSDPCCQVRMRRAILFAFLMWKTENHVVDPIVEFMENPHAAPESDSDFKVSAPENCFNDLVNSEEFSQVIDMESNEALVRSGQFAGSAALVGLLDEIFSEFISSKRGYQLQADVETFNNFQNMRNYIEELEGSVKMLTENLQRAQSKLELLSNEVEAGHNQIKQNSTVYSNMLDNAPIDKFHRESFAKIQCITNEMAQKRVSEGNQAIERAKEEVEECKKALASTKDKLRRSIRDTKAKPPQRLITEDDTAGEADSSLKKRKNENEGETKKKRAKKGKPKKRKRRSRKGKVTAPSPAKESDIVRSSESEGEDDEEAETLTADKEGPASSLPYMVDLESRSDDENDPPVGSTRRGKKRKCHEDDVEQNDSPLPSLNLN